MYSKYIISPNYRSVKYLLSKKTRQNHQVECPLKRRKFRDSEKFRSMSAYASCVG